MNLFKSAVAAVAVAGAGYLGYKAVKSEKAKVIARTTGKVVMAVATARTESPKKVEPVVAAVVVPVVDVQHQVVEVAADKPFEGAMSVTKDVQNNPRRAIVEVVDKGARVTQQHRVAKRLEGTDLKEKQAMQAAGL